MTDKRRTSDQALAIGKATVLPGMTIGFVLLVAGWIWMASQRWTEAEKVDEAQTVQIDDVKDRQAKYIKRRDAHHADLQEAVDALEADIHELKLYIQRQHTEVVR